MNQFVLGNLNYSSWSIRPLLVARHVGLPVEEVIIPLDFPETSAKLQEISPTARVPLLIWNGETIWESLAITEWIAEWAGPGAVWPEDPTARSVARAAACEMHAGFAALRAACPMDIRARHAAPDMTPALAADIARIDSLWTGLRDRFGKSGPFLFGKWSAADAFYAPVVTRFRTYSLPLSAPAQAYADAVLADPVFLKLEAEAAAEPWWIRYGPDGRSSGYLKPEG
ncbi:glutathione S-transferase [Hyphomonas johnsonii]|uniref:Glutathione S-transferase n=1 Tax=Hyphomonas johnsonii MHS-2 TaxID=1280950 RepID=A0A059FNR1_9PROT|nr:glutathione S-transferase [Hyphomonas johnsonii]KCZ92284.1 glutathione S-transferase [Hyphomonas johnsonii MHS-2]